MREGRKKKKSQYGSANKLTSSSFIGQTEHSKKD
jgi:uncharacterized protein Veg